MKNSNAPRNALIAFGAIFGIGLGLMLISDRSVALAAIAALMLAVGGIGSIVAFRRLRPPVPPETWDNDLE